MHKYKGNAKNHHPIPLQPRKHKSLVTKAVEAVILIAGLLASWAVIIFTLCM